MSKKDEIREKLASIMIDELEKGNLEWMSDLKSVSIVKQYNGKTKRLYQNSNAFFLSLVSCTKQYHDPRWYTFKQASELGYKIKKGEHGVPVEFFRIYDKETKKDVDMEWYRKLSLDEMKKAWENRLQMIYRYTTVFNAHQLEGIELLEVFEEQEKLNPDEIVMDLSKNLDVPIFFDSMNSPYYSPTYDQIHIPSVNRFKSIESLNSTILHELAHATGHESRMNRDLTGRFGTEEYAREELRAEIAAMFMSQQVRIEPDESHIQNHAAYVQSWIKVIKENPNELFKAIKEASAINDYMLDNLSIELKERIEVFQTIEVEETIEQTVGGINL